MQITDIVAYAGSAVTKELKEFQKIISAENIWRPCEDAQFVFLCGANIKNEVSKRRKAILDFSYSHLPNAKFFLAESIFSIFKKDSQHNLLDIENELSKFSDHVIVILESESAFCELGAFATHEELRAKLIVINDHSHKGSESFINLGPIKAIAAKSDKILYYKMNADGKEYGDAIGDLFSKLYNIIHKEPSKKRKRMTELNPGIYFTKDSLRFAHDLIYFLGPILEKELKVVIRYLFNTNQCKSLHNHLGLLSATEQISTYGNKYYKSITEKPFYEYDNYDYYNLIAAFKNFYSKYDKHRLYGIN